MLPGARNAKLAAAALLMGLWFLPGCGGEASKGPPLPYTPTPLEPAKPKAEGKVPGPPGFPLRPGRAVPKTTGS